MKFTRYLLCLALLGTATVAALASQEGISPLESFALTAIEEGTPVEIVGEANRGVLSKLRVAAFGKEFFLSREHIEQLKSFVFNGVQVSAEPGYQIVGGRTLFVSLQRGWSSSVDSRIVISISEDGRIKVNMGNEAR